MIPGKNARNDSGKKTHPFASHFQSVARKTKTLKHLYISHLDKDETQTTVAPVTNHKLGRIYGRIQIEENEQYNREIEEALKKLEESDLIFVKPVGNKCVFYINPIYYRFGNKIHESIRDIFKIPKDLFKQ